MYLRFDLETSEQLDKKNAPFEMGLWYDWCPGVRRTVANAASKHGYNVVREEYFIQNLRIEYSDDLGVVTITRRKGKTPLQHMAGIGAKEFGMMVETLQRRGECEGKFYLEANNAN